MIEKQKLTDFLLKNNSERQQSARLKKIEPFERIEIQVNNYQRSKKQVEEQLLAFHYLKCGFIKKNNQIQNQQTLVSRPLASNKQMKKIKIKAIPSNSAINIEKGFFAHSNKGGSPKIYMPNVNYQNVIHVEKQQTNFNDYFNIQKAKKTMVNLQLNQDKSYQTDTYEVINHFMKNPVSKRQMSEQRQNQQNHLYAIAKDNKSFNNQSTMALSKFFKNSPSPQRKIRKTQSKSISKSNGKSKSKSKNKSPLIIKNIQIKQLNKIDKIDLSGQNSIHRSNRKECAGQIQHKHQQNIKQSQRTVNLEYSKSIVNLSIQSQFIPSAFKNERTPQGKMINSFKSCKQEQDREAKMLQSEVVPMLKPNQSNEQEKKIKRVSIILKNQQLKRDPKNRANPQIKSEVSSISNKNSEQTQKRQINYDDQFTIFDHIKEVKIKNQKIDKPKIYLGQFKKTFGVKNQDQLKRQIQKQSRKFQQQKTHCKQKIRDQEQLFTSCQQVNYRRASSNPISISKHEKSKVQKSEQIIDEQQIQQEEEQENAGFPVFNYLLQKIDKLKQNQKQLKSKSKLPAYPQKMEKPAQLNDQSKRQSIGLDKYDENVLKPESYDHSSSSCSFIDGKEKVTSKQIDKMNNLVSETVKRVTVNLSKAVEQQNKSNSLLRSSNIMMDNKKQQENEKSRKEQRSVTRKDRLFKIFGDENNNNKHDEYDVSNNFFELNHDDFKQNGDNFSNPSTVQKISERSDSKSDVLQHLQSLRDDNFLMNKLFPQKQDDNKSQPPNTQTVLQPSDLFVKKEMPQQMLLPKQEVYKKSRQIVINIDDLKDASLSNDAISFSKLMVSQSKSLSLPEMVSFDIGTDSKYQPKKELQKKSQKIEASGFTKNGKVKRIQIQLQESSSSSQSEDQSTNMVKKQSSKLDHSQLDIDELDNYDSDEDQLNQDQKKRSGAIKPKEILTPVIQEDLQESALNRQETINIKSIKLNSKLQNKRNQTQKAQNEMKQLQLQFLKDFGAQKKESEVSVYKIPLQRIQQSSGKTIRNSTVRKSTSIKNDLEDNKFDDFSYSKEEQIKGPSIAAEKSFIEGIKQEIDNLKSKIESSFISDSSRIFNKSSYSQSKPMVSEKRIAIQHKNSVNKADAVQSHSSSIGKIFKSESIITEKVLQNDGTQKESDKQEIDFDILNEEDKQNQIYHEFKQDIDKLKNKMTFDAKIGLF